ncbi:MAG: hypothetical protein NC120_13045 [Ruminococcus sp.]|nr:hypothetical protein [Ruminococcus sp.]
MISAEELLSVSTSTGRKNYRINSRLKKPAGLINGQRQCAVSNHRLGIRKMSSNGCGPIAVFNAMYSAGLEPDFNAISLGIEKYALGFMGLTGTAPQKMESFMQKCLIPAVKAQSYEDFVNVMGAVRVGIICYWVAKPKRSLLHYAAVINNRNGTYDICNRYSNRKKPSTVGSIKELCPKESYVCGFFIS